MPEPQEESLSLYYMARHTSRNFLLGYFIPICLLAPRTAEILRLQNPPARSSIGGLFP